MFSSPTTMKMHWHHSTESRRKQAARSGVEALGLARAYPVAPRVLVNANVDFYAQNSHTDNGLLTRLGEDLSSP